LPLTALVHRPLALEAAAQLRDLLDQLSIQGRKGGPFGQEISGGFFP
jgi:hypothetical protein